MPEETNSTPPPPTSLASPSGGRASTPSAATPAHTSAVGTGTVTTTITTTETTNDEPEVLRLTLRGRSNVTWDESVVDNEGLGRKSSKRCCIFHKQRAFGESSTDSSDEERDGDGGHRKIARPKKKVPDYQRFHA